MSQANIMLIITIIYTLASDPSHNLNSRLTCVGMFWTIAGQVAKTFKSEEAECLVSEHDLEHNSSFTHSNNNDELILVWVSPSNFFYKKSHFSSVEDTEAFRGNLSKQEGQIWWKKIFEKLHMLASWDQIEIRKHILKIIENIFMKYGTTIEQRKWLDVINNIVMDILKSNVRFLKMSKDLHSEHNSTLGLDEWCLLIIQIIVRCIKKFRTNFDVSETNASNDELQAIWSETQSELIKLLPLLSSQALIGILGCIKELVKNNSNLIFHDKEKALALMAALNQTNMSQMKYKITEEILDIFKIMFDGSLEAELDSDFIDLALNIIKTIFKSMGKSEQSFTTKKPAKMLFEEKGVFSFVEKLGYLFKNDLKLEQFIINEFMTYSVKDPHQEAYARRSMVCFYNLIVQGRITNEDILTEIIPLLESRLIHFLNLRYYTEEANMILKWAKDLQTEFPGFPDFFFASGCVWLHIARYLINPKAYKEEVFNIEHQHSEEETKKSKAGFAEFMRENAAVSSDKFVCKEGTISPIVKDMVYNMLISSLKNEDQYGLFYSKKFTKSLPDDVVSKIETNSMNLDREILHTIISTMLPYCSKTNKEDREFLIDIMNKLITDQDFVDPEFSNNFFNLCRYDDETLQVAEVERKALASQSISLTVAVVKRIVDTYINHPDDEYRQSASTCKCITNILQSILNLQCDPWIAPLACPTLPSDCKSGHLFALLPILTPLITCKSDAVRQQLKLVYDKVNQELGIQMLQAQI